MLIIKESGLPSAYSCRYRQTPEYTTRIGSPRMIWAAPCLVYSLMRFGDFTRSKALSLPLKFCLVRLLQRYYKSVIFAKLKRLYMENFKKVFFKILKSATSRGIYKKWAMRKYTLYKCQRFFSAWYLNEISRSFTRQPHPVRGDIR